MTRLVAILLVSNGNGPVAICGTMEDGGVEMRNQLNTGNFEVMGTLCGNWKVCIR